MQSCVTEKDFARSFGTPVEALSAPARQLINDRDFRFEVIAGSEKDALVLDVLKRIEGDQQIVGSSGRHERWESGWAEALAAFEDSGGDLSQLVPKFIRPNQPIRLFGEYVKPANPNFERDFFEVYRRWIFETYLADVDPICEFGCGTGFNLVELAKLYPDKRLYGFDFAKPSCDLVNKIAKTHEVSVSGHLFDMRAPDAGVNVSSSGGILTIGAIEQLAGDFEKLLDFFLEKNAAIFVHVEPTIELYEDSELSDYLAMRFHKKRRYTQGYLTRLRELEKAGRIELLKVQRPYFGSLFMEGYSLIVWRPIPCPS